ncbi:MAG: hypothetical protein WBB22_00980 [Anaerolineae bacterium]
MKKAALLVTGLLVVGILACGGTEKATPSDQIRWEIEAPEGSTRTLFTKEALTDESCWDCVIGDLVRATLLEPGSGGCQRAMWDPGFSYCHVKVLTGDLAGKFGWVNINAIEKAP